MFTEPESRKKGPVSPSSTPKRGERQMCVYNNEYCIHKSMHTVLGFFKRLLPFISLHCYCIASVLTHYN